MAEDFAVASARGIASGQRENLSMIVKRDEKPFDKGRGPTKSTCKLANRLSSSCRFCKGALICVVTLEAWHCKHCRHFHDLAHTGARHTTKIVSDRFVWKRMKSDVRDFCWQCLRCQASKVTTHIKASLQKRQEPDRRFASLHVDLVGPLPLSNGFSYLFTIIDRFSRWPEAIPLADATAKSCAIALLHTWIARYGIPQDITSDKGRQFTSTLWKELSSLLGIQLKFTTSYHPQSNGMVERCLLYTSPSPRDRG